MKKLVVLCTFLLWINYVTAQTTSKTATLTTSAVPETVVLKFNSEFPGLQPKWEMDDKNYKAIYADPKTNSKGIIVYDVDGKVIRRDIEANTVQPQ